MYVLRLEQCAWHNSLLEKKKKKKKDKSVKCSLNTSTSWNKIPMGNGGTCHKPCSLSENSFQAVLLYLDLKLFEVIIAVLREVARVAELPAAWDKCCSYYETGWNWITIKTTALDRSSLFTDSAIGQPCWVLNDVRPIDDGKAPGWLNMHYAMIKCN